MKRLLQWIALTALALSLNSCGLPAALVRSTGSLLNSVGELVPAAAAAAAL
jgi:hypothetical protein